MVRPANVVELPYVSLSVPLAHPDGDARTRRTPADNRHHGGARRTAATGTASGSTDGTATTTPTSTP